MEPVPPNVTEDQLRLLLQEQHESDVLDYKRELDLVDKAKKTRTLVEVAKDVAAMASGRGAHIVVGADDRGQPSGLVTAAQAAQLDEARLRPRLEKYLPEGLRIRTATHEIDGKLLVLIHVSPHPDGLVIMRASGSHKVGTKATEVFREGDIFIRRGTESRRIGQQELREHLGDLRRRHEEEATARAISAVAPLRDQAERAEMVSSGSAELLSWDLDRATLVSAITNQIRRGDHVPLTLLMDSAPARAAEILRPDPDTAGEDLATAQQDAQAALAGLLDRLVAIAARGIVLRQREIVDSAIEALKAIYNAAFDERGYDRGDMIIPPARLWLMVIERVYALGALAVRKRDWGTVRRLAVHTPEIESRDYYQAWLRHGHIMAARAGLLEDPDNKHAGASLLKLALNHIAALPELRPDFDAEDGRLLSSLTQFDMLANLAVVSATDELSGSVMYPHFKRFYSHRSDPAVVALLEDPTAREQLYPGTDPSLADALRGLTALGSDEFFWVSGWDGFEDQRIVRFLEQYPHSN